MELKHKLTEIVKNEANFVNYRDGNLYYSIFVSENSNITEYTFPIDITNTEDIGNASFEASYSKALTLMRYVRKAIENNTIMVSPIGTQG